MATTDKKLEWIITEYGKRRITKLLEPDNEDKIRITVMNIGSDGSGSPKDREGKTPELGNGRLNHQVNGVGIPIIEKGIATDRENTIFFKTIINENMCGYDIAELALYEEANDGTLKMFAIGVGSPINKPHIRDGYLMSIEYTLYIESINLLDIYDKIELDPNNEFLKESDVDSLYRTILYVEGNLAEQIGNNTRAIGMGRAKELNNLIEETKLQYNSASISTYYSSLANSVKDLNNIIGFWSFHYTNNYGIRSNIRDFSLYSNYLSTNNLISSYDQDYLGVLSSLNFKEDDYFLMEAVTTAYVSTKNIELGQLKTHEIAGKAIYAPDRNGWMIGSTVYDEDTFKEQICEYYLKSQSVNSNSSTITIDVHPEYLDMEQKLENPNAGKPVFGTASYAPHTWTYDSVKERWISETSISYDEAEFKTFVVSYTGSPLQGDVISTATEGHPDRNEIITLTGKQFDLITYINDEDEGYKEQDVPFTFIISLQHNKLGERNTLLAQSSNFANVHNFEIVKTEDNAIEMTLYSTDEDKYIRFKTIKDAVSSSAYSLIITYNPNYQGTTGRFSPTANVVINGKKYDVSTENHGYTGMKENLMDTTSYVPTLVGKDNVKANTINAKVCLMALIREELDLNNMRCNSLILNSLSGRNVYFRI